MYHFRKLWLSIILVLTGILYVTSQNEVTVMVNILPPYTPYISDYIEDTGKVIVTLNYTSATGAPLDVYLHGSFTGSSTGINVYTDPNYMPPVPIHLENGQTYQLSPDEIGELYAMENVIYEGISAEEMMTSGALPEDYYQLCVRAYKYDTYDPVSQSAPSGCSSQFLISNIDPPIILAPMCGDEILMQNPQNIYVNWTQPVGTNPLFVTYYFRMVEVPFDSGIDPIDALAETSYASVYEEEVFNGTSLLLTNDKVQLAPNNTYAFSVQALSDTGDYYFKNNGVSEACWFTYNEEETGGFVQIDNDISFLDEFLEQFEHIPATKVSGRMFYKKPINEHTVMSHEIPNPLTGPKEMMPVSTGINYTDLSQAVIGYTGNANTNHMGIVEAPNTGYQIQMPPPDGRGLMNKETEIIDYNKPLPNTQVRLVVRLAVFDHGANFPSFIENTIGNGNIQGRGQAVPVGLIKIKDLEHKEHDANPNFINMVLDVTETDENGNFSFDFRNDFYTAACQVTTTSATHDEYEVPIILDPRDVVDPLINPNPEEYLQGIQQNPAVSTIQQNLELLNQQVGQQNEEIGGQHTTKSLNYHIDSSLLGYICLKVEVVNQKFCAPDVDIFAMPGDVVDVGNQVAKLKTYNAEIFVKSNGTIPQILNANEGIPNTKIKILRDNAHIIAEHPIVLKEEGQKLDSKTLTEDGKEFKDVSIGLTSMQSDSLGKITLKNLVKHWSGSTSGQQVYMDQIRPYFISVATRDGKIMDNDYENTFYNYKGKFKLLPTNAENTAVVSSENIAVICNNAYNVPNIPFEYVLAPEKPEIKGRVMAYSNIENVAVEGAEIQLFKYNIDENFIIEEGSYTTDETGFFRFPGLKVIGNPVTGPKRFLKISKAGYKTVELPTNATKYILNNGELLNFGDIDLEPASKLKGTVVDEEGEPVISFVRVLPNGPVYKTEERPGYIFDSGPQDFEIAANPSGNNIEIEPYSQSRYFTRVFENVAIPNGRKTFFVYKKLHRLWLTVTNQQGEIIPGADVVVGDNLASGKTDSDGVFSAKFTTADSQFVLYINAENYAPHQSILDLPIKDEKWKYEERQLTPSFRIFGHISDAQTKEKISNAKLFAEIDNTDGHHLYIETTTNNEGYYILNGIPWDTNQLELHISKDGNDPSYIGKSVDINVDPRNTAPYDFELNSIEGWDLSQILGFPMQVEGTRPDINNNPNRKLIKGYLHDMPTTIGFELQESNAKLFFNGVLVEKDAQGKVTPVADQITLNEIQVPLRINDVFVGKLMKPVYGNGQPTSKLKLEKIFTDKGRIKSGVKLDLESFRSEYSFDGNFYVGDNTNSYAAAVFNSNMGNSPQNNKRPIFDIGFDFSNYGQAFPKPIKGYEVYKFRADATLEDSFLQGDKVSLKTILHTEIPMGNGPDLDLKLPIGSVVVTQNDINIEQGPIEELKFNLEKWEVIAKDDWEFNKNEEAIVLKEVLIVSSNFSATVKNIKVRPRDQLREGQVEIDSGLSLGGIAPLILAEGLQPLFNYDATAGSGHYRISLVGESSTEEVAHINGALLEGTDDNIAFKSVGMLSNDVTVLSLDKTMRFYDIMNVNVNQIMTGDGSFRLKGMPNFNKRDNDNEEIEDTGIPDFHPPSVTINYEKENNILGIQILPLEGQIDLDHNVVYNIAKETTTQHFEDKKFTVEGGELVVSPSANDLGNENHSFSLTGKLTKTKNDVNIIVDPQPFYLGAKELNVTEGEIIADIPNDTWDLLSFKAKPNTDPDQMKGLNANSEFEFKVNGNIEVGSDNLKVDEIDCGFGKLSMAFNFEDPSMDGAMFIDLGPSGFTTGYATLFTIDLVVGFNPQGVYMGGKSHMAISAFTFDGALLIANTDANITSKTAPFLSTFKNNRPTFDNGLKGFYLIGQKSIFDDVGIDIGIASATASATAGVYVYCNFVDNNVFKVGGYGHAHGGGKIDAEVCKFEAYQETNITIDGGYDNGLYFGGCGDMRFLFEIDCWGDLFDTSTDKSYFLRLGTNGHSWGTGSCK